MALGGGGQVPAQAVPLRHGDQHPPPSPPSVRGQPLVPCATPGTTRNGVNGDLGF